MKLEFLFNLIKRHHIRFVLLIQQLILWPEIPDLINKFNLVLWALQWFFIPIKKTTLFSIINGAIGFCSIYWAIKTSTDSLSPETIASSMVILGSFRLIEYDAKEKAPFIYLLGLFLALIKITFQIDLMYSFLGFILSIYYLFQFFPRNYTVLQNQKIYRKHFKLILSALPLTLILFLTVPRLNISGFMQSASRYSQGQQTGFSGEILTPNGQPIVPSDKVAFRAEFKNINPDLSELYWRGEVLDRANEFSWKKNSNLKTTDRIQVSEAGLFDDYETITDIQSYKINLEPHNKNNLFTLIETTEVHPAQNKIYQSLSDSTFKSSQQLEQSYIYTAVIGSTKALAKKIPQELWPYYLETDDKHDSLKKFIQQLQSQQVNTKLLSPERKAQALLKYFNQNDFSYSLYLGDQAPVSMADFLFKKKVGFCEQYATTTAYLLRLWGVPSRVVVGYQGGEYNTVGRFWTITQKDAHAWVEYLNSQQTWQTLDPVLAVAPDRISFGAKDYFSDLKNKNTLLQFAWKSYDLISSLAENLNYRWSLFFINYSQQEFWSQASRFFIELTADLKLNDIMGALIGLIFCWIVLRFFYSRYIVPEELQIHKSFHRAFKKYNLDQMENESFHHWKQRLIQKNPNQEHLIHEIFKLYLSLRFSGQISLDQHIKLKSQLKNIDFKNTHYPTPAKACGP